MDGPGADTCITRVDCLFEKTQLRDPLQAPIKLGHGPAAALQSQDDESMQVAMFQMSRGYLNHLALRTDQIARLLPLDHSHDPLE